MRFGIIADIHGNLEALNSFLALLSSKGFDRLVVAGDVVGYGADPAACLETVLQHDPVIIAGNHDWAVSGKIDTEYFNDMAKQAIDWTREVLSDDERERLDDFPLEATVEGIRVVHSTPVVPASWDYLLDQDDVRRIQSEISGITVIGHSHVPFVYGCDADNDEFHTDPGGYRLATQWSYVINVGSIGQPRDGIPLASGAILDTEEHHVELLREPYPIDRAAEKILREPLLPDYLALRLFKGF